MPSRRTVELFRDGERSSTGPALAPAPPRFGPVATLVAAARLPADLLVALSYVARELPFLLQDLRSSVNDIARLAHGGDPGALSHLLTELSEAAGSDGALRHLLESATELAETRTEVERRHLSVQET